jgi:hypothetical protein
MVLRCLGRVYLKGLNGLSVLRSAFAYYRHRRASVRESRRACFFYYYSNGFCSLKPEPFNLVWLPQWLFVNHAYQRGYAARLKFGCNDSRLRRINAFWKAKEK